MSFIFNVEAAPIRVEVLGGRGPEGPEGPPGPGGSGDALVANNLDQFADVTQTSGATLTISASATISGTNTGDQDLTPYQLKPSEGAFANGDKTKLDGIAAGANNYTLPAPTTTVIGGVKRNTGAGGQFVSGISSTGDLEYGSPSGSGDVVGPASATNNAVAVFDGTTGKLLKNGVILGTAATANTGDFVSVSNYQDGIGIDVEAWSDYFATASQGDLADTAVQLAALNSYLPLAGGTMTGNQIFTSGTQSQFQSGSHADFQTGGICNFEFGSEARFANGTINLIGTGGFNATVNFTSPTAARTITFPDASGTVALTSDLDAYQPLDIQLTSLAGLTYASNTLKVVRVNAGETGFELATISAGGGDALTANPLSQFAATTSSQLAGVISDETGSGALVFANSPTLVTPALGTPSALVLTNATGLPSTGVINFAADVAATAAVTANTSKVSNATHTGDVTGDTSLTIANDAVTNAKLANMATATIKGRTTAGTGDPEDLTPAQARTVMELGTAATTDSSDYATAAQGALADTAVQPAALGAYLPLEGGTMTGNLNLGGFNLTNCAEVISTAGYFNTIANEANAGPPEFPNGVTIGTGTTKSTVTTSASSAQTINFPDASGDVILTASAQTLTDKTLVNFTEGVVSIGNSGTSKTISLADGTFQTVTLTGNCTFTMPTATAGKSFILKVMTGAGSFTAAFTGVKWSGGTAPTITAAASKYDLISFVADGTAWSGSALQNFTA